MNSGFLSARYPMVWTGKQRAQILFLNPEDVKIRGTFSLQPLPAYICKSCKTVLFHYED